MDINKVKEAMKMLHAELSCQGDGMEAPEQEQGEAEDKPDMEDAMEMLDKFEQEIAPVMSNKDEVLAAITKLRDLVNVGMSKSEVEPMTESKLKVALIKVGKQK